MTSPQKSIVVVNDDLTQLHLLTRVLEKEGHHVKACRDVGGALAWMTENGAPSLIITDLHMPEIDGWRFCRLIRSPEYPSLNQVPVLVFSMTYAGEEVRRITAELGANGFLQAPFSASVLKSQVSALLEGESFPVKPKVMIAASPSAAVERLAAAFAQHGYVVIPVTTGEEARREFARQAPEAVVIWDRLSDMQGDRLLGEFRSPATLAMLTMVTQDPTPQLATEWLRRGADVYVREPFDPEYLIAMCEKAGRQRALMRIEDLLEQRTRELRASEERVRLALAGARQSLWEWNVREGRGYVNPQGQEVLGYAPGEIGADPRLWRALVHSEDVPVVELNLRALLSGRMVCYEGEHRLKSKLGDWKWVMLRGTVVERQADGTAARLVGTLLDVTDHRLAEERLRESEVRYRTLFDASTDAIFLETLDGQILDCNTAACAMFGYTKEEFTQLRVQELLPTEVAAELPHLVTEAKLHEGGVFLESLNRRKTGESFPVEVSIRGATIGGRRCVLVYVRDITARKKSEQEQAQLAEQLRQSQKMEAIGQLAGGLAHDFNNLLAAIRGSAEMLLLDPTFDSAVHQIARTIDKAAERGSELTQKLLGFARGGKTQNVPTDLNHIVREVMALLGRTIHKNIRLSQRLGVEKAAVMGDPGQLHQVLMNIAINARDAMPDGGDLSIETDLVSLDETFCRTHPGMTPKRHVHVRISDTGCGIPRENLERIFDPFFTTKPAGQGSGLGLTVVYGIVKTHSGCIEVQTRQGVGTTFHLYLPLAEGAEPAPAVPPPAAPVRGTGRILLVDDEEGVRTVAALILRKLGYEVAIAENGRVAVDYYRQHGTSVDLVVLDMVMPELDGQQCFRQLRKLNPAVKVILCTGFSTDARTQQTVKEGAISLIQKPFRIADFSLAVDQAMKMKPA